MYPKATQICEKQNTESKTASSSKNIGRQSEHPEGGVCQSATVNSKNGRRRNIDKGRRGAVRSQWRKTNLNVRDCKHSDTTQRRERKLHDGTWRRVNWHHDNTTQPNTQRNGDDPPTSRSEEGQFGSITQTHRPDDNHDTKRAAATTHLITTTTRADENHVPTQTPTENT